MKSPYQKYLEITQYFIDKYFKEQAPYIHCKSGCSSCCERGSYPFTFMEFEYLMSGYRNLSDEVQSQIKENINKIKSEKASNDKDVFLYRCPFLTDNQCACYEQRGLVCRTHGLLTDFTKDNGEHIYLIPYCAREGLNYSQVYDEKNDMISKEKWEQLRETLQIEVEPLAYNVGFDSLIDNQISVGLNISFGVQKPLIDWFGE